MKQFSVRNYGLEIMGWLTLAIVLFFVIPLLYPARLPVAYHIYHFVFFIVLLGAYYFNIRVAIPRTVKKSISLPYIFLFLAISGSVIGLMSLTEIALNLQEKVYHSLYPEKTFIASEHKSYVNYYVFFVTAIVLGVGFTNFLIKKWNLEERKKLALQELKAKAELGNLKAQINPHFFFNTLNTIYALTHKDVEKSQNAILTLSKMMRYAMNEENQDFVSLNDELNFIRSYLELMSHRLSSNVSLEYTITAPHLEAKIAPMLLLTFIENCFKHGVNSEEGCIIKIGTYIKGNTLVLETENHWFERTDESKGIGIENTKKRLDILYGDNYSLKQIQTGGKYITTLKINLK